MFALARAAVPLLTSLIPALHLRPVNLADIAITRSELIRPEVPIPRESIVGCTEVR